MTNHELRVACSSVAVDFVVLWVTLDGLRIFCNGVDELASVVQLIAASFCFLERRIQTAEEKKTEKT